jgi:hypothetical protein
MARVAVHVEKKADASALHALLRKMAEGTFAGADAKELLRLVRESKRITMSVRKGENEPKDNAR